MKLTAGIILFFLLGVVCSLLFQGGTLSMDYSIRELYLESAQKRLGGGVISGSLAWGCTGFLAWSAQYCFCWCW